MIGGLKPYLQMKDSGVAWLGEVPAHWSVERLKSSIGNVIEQTASARCGDLYIALEHVESWTGRLRPTGQDVTFDSQVKRFRAGDVLFGKLRPYLAKVTRAPSHGVCVGEFLVLRPSESDVYAPYIEKLLRSKPVIDAVNSSTFGAKMPRAEWQFMGSMSITLPPPPNKPPSSASSTTPTGGFGGTSAPSRS
jgi:type I restriction enzyme S subunit